MGKLKKNIILCLKILYIGFIIGISILFSTDWHDSIFFKSSSIKACNGILDLKDWNQQKYKTVAFHGEWEFYWKKFVNYKDFLNKEADGIVKAPSVWKNYKIEGDNLSGMGYATYHLKVVGAKPNEPLAIRMPVMATSYRLYVDDELLTETGIIGESKDTAYPRFKVKVVEFVPESSEFHIFVQISNFSHARGGFGYSPQIGTTKGIKDFNNFIMYRDVFLMGCFLLMMLNAILVYVYRREGKDYLYFAILCFFCATRLLRFSSYILSYIPFISRFDILVRIDYFSFAWIFLTFLLLIQSQFTNILPVSLVKKSIYFVVAYTAFIFILPVSVFTHMTILIQGICFTMAGIGAYRMVVLFLKGERFVLVSLTASSLFLGTAVHDLLLQTNVISCAAIEISPVGFLIFLFSEAVLIAKKYTILMEEYKFALETIMEVTKKEKETELKFLRAQIKPHFVHNALNSIIAVSRKDSEKSRELLMEFSLYLRNCFDVDNLESFIPLEKEIQFLQSYLAIEQVRFGDLFTVKYDMEAIDIQIPPLILQPLVENALIHGIRNKFSNGIIEVFIKKQKDGIYLGVKDDGIGILPAEAERLLKGETDYQGVGLYNINQRLQRMYGKSLIIESLPTGGTHVYMILPC